TDQLLQQCTRFSGAPVWVVLFKHKSHFIRLDIKRVRINPIRPAM
ncbi:hypothetical protein A671_02486, partial [Salmonella enterica subsp. enterica serovar Dublin str. DG22]